MGPGALTRLWRRPGTVEKGEGAGTLGPRPERSDEEGLCS